MEVTEGGRSLFFMNRKKVGQREEAGKKWEAKTKTFLVKHSQKQIETTIAELGWALEVLLCCDPCRTLATWRRWHLLPDSILSLSLKGMHGNKHVLSIAHCCWCNASLFRLLFPYIMQEILLVYALAPLLCSPMIFRP